MKMTTYISILRGINVSGRKLIKMDVLRKMYEGLGFQNTKTYLQSGNVVFSNNNIKREKLELRISDQIEKDFEFDVLVIVLTIAELSKIIDCNPFFKQPNIDQTFLHVTFLSSKPKEIDFELIKNKKQNGEEIIFSDNAVYLYCPNGYGKTKLTNSFLETKLKVGATTRNWKTTNELLKIAKQI